MKPLSLSKSRNPFLRLQPALVALASVTAAFAAPVTFSTYTASGPADTSWVLTDPGTASINFGGIDTSFGSVPWEGTITNGHNSSETYAVVGGYAVYFSQPNVAWGNIALATFYPTNPSATILHDGVWKNGNAQIDINGLTIGREYTVKLIIADSRSDGATTTVSAINGSTGSSANAQYAYTDGRFLVVTATWTADATTLTLDPFTGGGRQLNAFQILPGPLPAGGNFTWDNGATTATWNTTDPNWTGSTWNNNAVNNAIFGATGAGAITVGSPISVGNLTFNAPGYTISGSTLGLESSTITNNDPVTITSNLTGAGLTKAGAGALTLAGPIAYSGATTVSGGSLVLESGATFGALSLDSATTVTLAANDASLAVYGNLTLHNGATLAATGTPNSSYGNVWLPPFGQQVIATGDATSTISSQLNLQELHTFDVADGASATDLLISGYLTHISNVAWGGLSKSGDGTLELTSGNAHGGNYLNAGTLVFANGSLGLVFGPYPFLQFGGDSTLRWAAGNTQDVSAGGELIIANGVTATLDTNGNDVTLGTAISSASGSLVKAGAGILTLAAANSYSGDTKVTGGTLSLANANLADASTVTVENGAVLNLTHGATDIVGTLVLGLNTYTSGTFSAATHSPFISGSGIIQVGATPPDPFADWMSTNYPTILAPNNLPGADPENDGIKNLLEYVLQGGDPSVSNTGTLPTLDASGANFVFTYFRRAAATGTTQTFEYGSTLTGWTPVAIPGSGVVVTSDDPVVGIEKVVITVAKGTETKLFGRLRVTQP